MWVKRKEYRNESPFIRVVFDRAIRMKWRRRASVWILVIQCQIRKSLVNYPIVSTHTFLILAIHYEDNYTLGNCVDSITAKGDVSTWATCSCPLPCKNSQFDASYTVAPFVRSVSIINNFDQKSIGNNGRHSAVSELQMQCLQLSGTIEWHELWWSTRRDWLCYRQCPSTKNNH